MQRRQFLQSAAAAAVLLHLDAPAFARKTAKLGRGRLKVGILSDIHVKSEDHPFSQGVFIKALEYFRDIRVDAVLLAGDLADSGTRTELRLVSEAWYKVFPDDKGADGQRVEKLFIYGNHDTDAWKWNSFKSRSNYESEIYPDRLAQDKAGIWQECFHEPWSPIYIKDVKGYKFIGAHYASKSSVPGIAAFFKEHASELPGPGKPFFYFQHPHPKGTCSGPWVWGQDNGEVTALLSTYPNAIAFSGHSHTTLTDERVVWQGAFTSIGTASLSYVGALGGRENSTVFGSSNTSPLQMAQVRCREVHQGMVMTVYDDCITLQRRDFGRSEDLADNWIIPLDASGGAMSHERRAAKEPAPQFGPGAIVTAVRHPGKDRSGKELEQMAVSFPTAPRTASTPRALDYEICVEVEDVDTWKTVLTKRVYSGTVFLSEAVDADATAVCEFAVSELPEGRSFRFSVRPCSSFGRKGGEILSEKMTI